MTSAFSALTYLWKPFFKQAFKPETFQQSIFSSFSPVDGILNVSGIVVFVGTLDDPDNSLFVLVFLVVGTSPELERFILQIYS